MQQQGEAGMALLCFTGSEMSEQDVCAKGKSIHIFCRRGVDLP